MKLRYVVAASLLNLATTGAHALTSKDLVGCWRVQSVVIDPNGTKSEPLGREPAGRLIFTDGGHMSFVVMRLDLPSEWQMTDDRIVTTLITYFGTYELKDRELSIKAEGSTRVDRRGQPLNEVSSAYPKQNLSSTPRQASRHLALQLSLAEPNPR
jgi:hypothetical protein